jgi:hypothetical protein
MRKIGLTRQRTAYSTSLIGIGKIVRSGIALDQFNPGRVSAGGAVKSQARVPVENLVVVEDSAIAQVLCW